MFAGRKFVETTLSVHLKGKTFGKPSKYSIKENFGKLWTIAKCSRCFPLQHFVLYSNTVYD